MKLSKVELMMTRFLWLKNSRVCDSELCNFEMYKRFVRRMGQNCSNANCICNGNVIP